VNATRRRARAAFCTAACVARCAAALGAGVVLAGCAPRRTPPAAATTPTPRVSPAPGVVVGVACVPTGVERCFDARDDNCNGLFDEGCGVPTGPVQFLIAWAEPTTDVDLLVSGPDGELAEMGRATSAGLVKVRDCPGRGQECAGQNLENVIVEEGEAPRGTYDVRVRLERLGAATLPVVVTFGARVGPKSFAGELELPTVEAERSLQFEL
jgi:hypothetical protein